MSNTQQHTPGPWMWDEDNLSVRQARTGIAIAKMMADNGHPDPVYRKPLPMAANARLIANAPELLDALRGIVWKLSRTTSPSGNGGDCIPATIDSRDATISIARAAIARAEGRTA